MQHIETVTVGSTPQATITFSSIPDSFTDLLFVISGRSNSTNLGQDVTMKFNGSSTGYNSRVLFGTGSVAGSDLNYHGTDEGLCGQWNGGISTANTFGNSQCYIPNYRSSVAKSWSSDMVSEANTTAAVQQIVAGSWSGTDPITSIAISGANGSDAFVEHSTISLFGITAGSDGIVTVS